MMRVLLVAVLGLASSLPSAGESEIRYNRDIRPILSDKCFFCHGPDKNHREADLRLDIRAEALADNDGVRAIVPGDLSKSELVYRIETDDEDDLMPPKKSHKHLNPEEIKMLKAWIVQGAEYEEFWAYAPITKPDVPKKVKGWTSQNEIDRFIQKRLKKEGLEPSDEADKRTLARRVYFDLIGLPPTPEDVEAFVGDKSPRAYEKVVDRLLDHSGFGERLAIKWLDLVRYADSSGYHSDYPLSHSPYRDYVIKAFNDNKHFDQFTREQLAGDLLENPTREQKVATAYNRLNLTTDEGGAQAKEYLSKYLTDRVRNVSAVWMGATMGCAECHDHKFDPITAKDFYSMGAFFADVKEPGQYSTRGFSKNRDPLLAILDEDEQRKEEELLKRRHALEYKVSLDNPEVQKDFAIWVKEQETAFAEDRLPEPKREDVELVGDKLKPGTTFSLKPTIVKKGDPGVQVFAGKTSRKQTSDGRIQHIYDFGKHTRSALEGDVLYAMVWIDPDNPPSAIMLQVRRSFPQAKTSSWNHRAYWGADTISFGKDSSKKTAYLKKGDLPATGEWVRLEVNLSEIGVNPHNYATISGLGFAQFGGTVFWDEAGLHSFNGGQDLDKLKELLALDANDEKRERFLFNIYVSEIPELLKQREEAKVLVKELEELRKNAVTVPITVSVPPREVKILPRGDWMDDSGTVVQAAIPEFLGKLETGDKPATRLDLANWLMADDNPLTARVFMNNLWQIYFGTAISKVQDDLGGQGEWPSHIELLDWLAHDFKANDWDIKRAIKQIVMSHTYRQSSVIDKAVLVKDPGNRLLSRQSIHLLPAEVIRDHALALSGLLVDHIGGESTKPYQPAGYYRELNFPKRKYKSDDGDNQYRRGVYTWIQRTFLHPSMKAFDAPSRENCTASRPKSNTPLQALAMMNDPTYVESARVFAVRIMEEGGSSLEEQVDWAWREVYAEEPPDMVSETLLEVYNNHRKQYEGDQDAAEALLRVGLSSRGHDKHAPEVAAWTSVARVLFNMHEFITRS